MGQHLSFALVHDLAIAFAHALYVYVFLVLALGATPGAEHALAGDAAADVAAADAAAATAATVARATAAVADGVATLGSHCCDHVIAIKLPMVMLRYQPMLFAARVRDDKERPAHQPCLQPLGQPSPLPT